MGTATSAKLDLRIIFDTALQLFAPWLASVLIVTWAGYPGVVCVTPLAWLLALRVGLRVSMRSRSEPAGRRILEAGLAGGIFGLLQGILFFLIIGRAEILPDERTNALILNIAMAAVGILAGAGLAALNAWLFEGRRKRQADQNAQRNSKYH